MGLADDFEQAFSIGGDIQRTASPPLGRSQQRIRASASTQKIDEYPGIEIDAHSGGQKMSNELFGSDDLGLPSRHQSLQQIVPGNQEIALTGAAEDEDVVRVRHAIS